MLIDRSSLVAVSVLCHDRIVHRLESDHIYQVIGYLSRFVVRRIGYREQYPKIRYLLREVVQNLVVTLGCFNLADASVGELA